ncbi:MAG TPA: hypothetical protein ENJ95_07165, partial [Bacteroidetes bacterium]|nr:hypothetical protein [Bacteroidota bacterium]
KITLKPIASSAIGQLSGSLVKGQEKTWSSPMIGDTENNQQVHAFLTFDLSGLPGPITPNSISFSIPANSISGNCGTGVFVKGNMYASDIGPSLDYEDMGKYDYFVGDFTGDKDKLNCRFKKSFIRRLNDKVAKGEQYLTLRFSYDTRTDNDRSADIFEFGLSGSSIHFLSAPAKELKKPPAGAEPNNIPLIVNSGILAETATLVNLAADIKEGTYFIQSKVSGKVLDIQDWSKAAGGNIWQWQKHGGANQQFEIKAAGGGYYSIRSLHSNMYLDVQNGSAKGGANVWQYPWNGTDAQLWRFVEEKKGSGYYRIFTKLGKNLCIDLPYGKKDNGVNIQIETRNQWEAQVFRLVPVPAQGNAGSGNIAPAARSATVSGTARNTTGVNGPITVFLEKANGSYFEEQSINGKSGSFSFPDVPDGRYHLTADILAKADFGVQYTMGEKWITVKNGRVEDGRIELVVRKK